MTRWHWTLYQMMVYDMTVYYLPFSTYTTTLSTSPCPCHLLSFLCLRLLVSCHHSHIMSLASRLVLRWAITWQRYQCMLIIYIRLLYNNNIMLYYIIPKVKNELVWLYETWIELVSKHCHGSSLFIWCLCDGWTTFFCSFMKANL